MASTIAQAFKPGPGGKVLRYQRWQLEIATNLLQLRSAFDGLDSTWSNTYRSNSPAQNVDELMALYTDLDKLFDIAPRYEIPLTEATKAKMAKVEEKIFLNNTASSLMKNVLRDVKRSTHCSPEVLNVPDVRTLALRVAYTLCGKRYDAAVEAEDKFAGVGGDAVVDMSAFRHMLTYNSLHGSLVPGLETQPLLFALPQAATDTATQRYLQLIEVGTLLRVAAHAIQSQGEVEGLKLASIDMTAAGSRMHSYEFDDVARARAVAASAAPAPAPAAASGGAAAAPMEPPSNTGDAAREAKLEADKSLRWLRAAAREEAKREEVEALAQQTFIGALIKLVNNSDRCTDLLEHAVTYMCAVPPPQREYTWGADIEETLQRLNENPEPAEADADL